MMARGEKDRSCTDVCCTVLFFVFWIVMLFIAQKAIVCGDPVRLIAPKDYLGQTCGSVNSGGANDRESTPKAVYPRLESDTLKMLIPGSEHKLHAVCVDDCPSQREWVCEIAESTLLGETLYPGGGAGMVDTVGRRKYYLSVYCNDFGNPAITEAEMVTCDKFLGPRTWVVNNRRVDAHQEAKCWRTDAETHTTVFNRCLPQDNKNRTKFVQYCIAPPQFAGVELVESENDPNYNKTVLDGCERSKLEQCDTTEKSYQKNPILEELVSWSSVLHQKIADLRKTQTTILVNGVGVAIIMGLVWLFLLQWCTCLIVWGSVIGCVLMCFGMTMYSGLQAGWYSDSWSHMPGYNPVAVVEPGMTSSEVTDVQRRQALQQYFGYATWVFMFITVIVTGACWTMLGQIQISVGIIKEAATFLKRMPLIILFPLLTLIIYGGIVYYWLYVLVNLATCGSAVFTDIGVETGLTADQNGMLLVALHCFGFFWTAETVEAIGTITVAGSVSELYFTRVSTVDANGKEVGGQIEPPKFPIWKAFARGVGKHLGSVIFGSAIIGMVKTVRFLLNYFEDQVAQAQEQSAVLKYVLSVLRIILLVLGFCMKYIGTQAYVMVAMRGTNFLSSAKGAFDLMRANVVRICVVDAISDWVLLIAKINIAMTSTFFMALEFSRNSAKYGPGGESEVSGTLLPLCMTFFFSFVVASSYMNVYDMAVDTVLMCVCIDEENEAEGGDDYDTYYSAELRDLLDDNELDDEDCKEQMREQKRNKRAERKKAGKTQE